MIERFRQERLKQLKRLQQARFGRVYPIGRDDYTREVTEASKVSVDQDGNVEDGTKDEDEDEDEEEDLGPRKEKTKGKGTGVVCFLYKDG